MRPIYLQKESSYGNRKIMVDMAYLVTHKKIRLLKYLFEDNLFILHKNSSGNIEKFFLTKDKIIKEDENHFYFNFLFKKSDVENVSI